MNLWLRLLWTILAAWRATKLNPLSDVSRLPFRVWPHDLDTSLHMNNGRYWTLMDLGRADVMLRSGLWRAVLKHKWVPVVSAGQIRFRRELRLGRAFRLETRISAWAESWVMMEHRIVATGRDGADILAAIALVRVGLYDRRAKAFVPVARMMAEIGLEAPPPAVGTEVEAFLAAEDALRIAA
ncbi:MAG TPA: acyl-CoA thioesterase [Beijerinckiaceae bacterium]|jgi:acyl-CoA thioesterase FadM